MKLIKVAVGIVQNIRNEFLIAQRSSEKHLGGFWEFPGGKIEPDETSLQALIRELDEEVNLEVIAANPLVKIHHDYPEKSVQLDVWQVTGFKGPVFGKEGQLIKWVGKADLARHQFPAANQKIMEFIN